MWHHNKGSKRLGFYFMYYSKGTKKTCCFSLKTLRKGVPTQWGCLYDHLLPQVLTLLGTAPSGGNRSVCRSEMQLVLWQRPPSFHPKNYQHGSGGRWGRGPGCWGKHLHLNQKERKKKQHEAETDLLFKVLPAMCDKYEQWEKNTRCMKLVNPFQTMSFQTMSETMSYTITTYHVVYMLWYAHTLSLSVTPVITDTRYYLTDGIFALVGVQSHIRLNLSQ